MSLLQWALLSMGMLEMLLLATIVVLFIRLRRSETLFLQLRQNQKELLDKLHFNSQLEQQLVTSFSERQKELGELDKKLQSRAKELRALVDQAKKYSDSPRLVRQVVLSGYDRGEKKQVLARQTGLSLEEVDWIIDQNRSSRS
jgi:biopolymer transport protein ExbB/TolQ